MRKNGLKFFAIIIIYLFFINTAWADEEKRIIEGVKIEGVDVGNMTSTQAQKAIEKKIEQILKLKLKLYVPNAPVPIETTFSQLGVKIDTGIAISKALEVGNEGNILLQWWQRWNVKRNGMDIELTFNLDRLRARFILQELLKPFEIAPQDARIFITSKNEVEIMAHLIGSEADIDKCLIDILASLRLDQNCQALVRFKSVNPLIKEEDIKAMNVTGVLASFTTQFNPGNANRTKNVKLAAEALNNRIILPNAQFSFNAIVGPRTEEAGYNEATIIQNNEFTAGLGGGVCQVSSTLYNSALLANLQVDERFNHTLLINYVPSGQDAAVVYGYKDLKFTNNSGGHLIIRTSVYGSSLNIKIFGNHEVKPKVKIKSITERTIPFNTKIIKDNSLSPGKVDVKKEGKAGLVVRVEKETYDTTGKLIKKEVISRDAYPPINGLVHIHAATEEEHGLEVTGDSSLVTEQLNNRSLSNLVKVLRD